MQTWIDPDTFDFRRFAEKIEKLCQEGVKWEIRKLEWIREERAKQHESGNEVR
jgi:hypothetical protein